MAYKSIYSSKQLHERVVEEREKWEWPQPKPIDRARWRRERESKKVKDVWGPANERGWSRVVRYRWDGEWGVWWAQYSWMERSKKLVEQLSLFGKEV